MPGLMLAYLFSTQLVCGASFSAAELLGGQLIILILEAADWNTACLKAFLL